MRAKALVFLLSAALLVGEGTASANGRFPEAQAIETNDGKTVYLRTTFGILVSRDAGAHWRWICERALGYDGVWDPPIALDHDGKLWVGLQDGLVWTKDGCTLGGAKEFDGHLVKDLTVDESGFVWAITGAPGKRAYVWKGTEKRASFDDTNLLTIEVSGKRVYVSGEPYSTIKGRIYRSNDSGATFQFVGKEAAEGPYFIGAIDPNDHDRILVRHLHAKGSDLLLSKDGGDTFTNVVTMTSAMFGFAKSSDGSTYWAGSGLADHGLFRSVDRGEHFERIASRGVLCLHATPDGSLFACDNTLTPGANAVSFLGGDAKTSRALARFADVEGPVECASPDSRMKLCAWGPISATLSPPSRDPAPSRSAKPTEAPAQKSKCSCRVAGEGSSDGTVFVLLLAACVWAWRASRVDRRFPKGAPLRRRTRTSGGKFSAPPA